MRITLDVFGDVQLDRELLRFQQRPGNLEPLFEELADDFLTLNRRQFDTEGGNSGGWAPLAPSTVRRRGSSNPILDDTGDLRASLTRDGAKGSIREITDDSLFVGTNIDYARYHQTGTGELFGQNEATEGASGMPRRRPVEFTEGDRRRWVKTIQRFLLTGQAEVGL